MDKVKLIAVTVTSALMSLLGNLAVPVFLLVGCNLIDYFTGLYAAKYRNEKVDSYKSFRGILKKVCMWLLVVVGAIIDTLLNYGVEYIGLGVPIPSIVATIVAVWLIVNEVISILENMVDIGVELPPFLLPLIKNIRKQVEDKSNVERDEK